MQIHDNVKRNFVDGIPKKLREDRDSERGIVRRYRRSASMRANPRQACVVLAFRAKSEWPLTILCDSEFILVIL